MKNKIFILAAAALAVLYAASCNKQNKDTDNYANVPEKAQYLDVAAKYIVADKSSPIRDIEFTESGYAIVTILSSYVKSDDEEVEYETIVTTFTYADGVFTVKGIGDVTLKDDAITLDGEDYTAAQVAKRTEDIIKGLAGTWDIKSINIHAEGGKLGKVGVTMAWDSRPFMKKICKWLGENGVGVPTAFLDYEFNDITVTSAGTFMVTFDNRRPFIGTWDFENDQFSYELPQDIAPETLSAKAVGSATLTNSNKTCTLKGNSKYSYANEDYDLEATLQLVRVNIQ